MDGRRHAFALMTNEAAASHDAGNTVIRVTCGGGREVAKAVFLCCRDQIGKNRWVWCIFGLCILTCADEE